MRFIADAMLGKLARWLRFLGCDTLYYPDISDSELIKIAREQSRTVLTRDVRLTKRKGLQGALLIHANDAPGQLVEFFNFFHVKQCDALSRCVSCNGQLVRILNKSEIQDRVPEYVFLHHENFFQCAGCDKIYWEGSHPKNFREILHNIVK